MKYFTIFASAITYISCIKYEKGSEVTSSKSGHSSAFRKLAVFYFEKFVNEWKWKWKWIAGAARENLDLVNLENKARRTSFHPEKTEQSKP